MGCPSSVELAGNLVFSICTHDPDTGVLTDADSAPSYRVYEDETATAILTGSMAKLDDTNTTGFYTEQLECTAANGFEEGKTYTVYIEATVMGDTGGIAYAFRIITYPTGFAGLTITAGRVSANVLTIASGAITAASFGINAISADSLAAAAVTKIQSGLATSTALADGTVQVGTVRDGAIGAAAVADIFSTTAITEAYADDGTAGTVAQILYLIQQSLHEFAISDRTRTVKKLDGSTTAATFTLDDADAPTSTTRAS